MRTNESLYKLKGITKKYDAFIFDEGRQVMGQSCSITTNGRNRLLCTGGGRTASLFRIQTAQKRSILYFQKNESLLDDLKVFIETKKETREPCLVFAVFRSKTQLLNVFAELRDSSSDKT
jgi:hypothetical protein